MPDTELIIDGELNTDNEFDGEMFGGMVVEGIKVSTTSEWASKSSYVPPLGEIIVYSDYYETDGNDVPALKIGDGVNTVENLMFIDADLREELENAGAPAIVDKASGAIASFPDGAKDKKLKSLIFDIEPQQSGSGDPSPTNIRPISGWSQVDAWQTGGNLLNYDAWKSVSVVHGTGVFENNGVTLTATANDCYTSFNSSGGYSSAAQIPVKVGQSITLSWDTPDTAVAAQVYIFPNGSTTGLVSTPAVNKKLTYTPTAGITYVTFRLGVTANGTTVHYKNLMVNFGTAAAAYTPFTDKRAITISLGQTVYGGAVDALAGEGESGYGTYNLKSHNQSYITQYDYNGKHGVMINYALPSTQTRAVGWCDTAPVSTEANYNSNQYMWFGVNSTAVFWIGILDALGTDLAGFKTWLAAHDVTICRPLASPTALFLTPVSVSSLLGQNNIWASCGDTEVEYVADTKLYIEKLTQPTEDDMIANNNIASGKYFMIGNALYLSTAAISAGETIKPGTNCTLTNLAAALNAINS